MTPRLRSSAPPQPSRSATASRLPAGRAWPSSSCLSAASAAGRRTAESAGAVIAPGTVVVDSNVKKVQHPTGGIVGEIRVQDGDRVEAGDLLVRLDETVTRANLQIDHASSSTSWRCAQARLEAERDGAAAVSFPPHLIAARRASRTSREILAGERRLFESRRDSRAGPEGAAARAHRPAQRGDRRPRPLSIGAKAQRDRAHRQGAGGRGDALGEEPRRRSPS